LGSCPVDYSQRNWTKAWGPVISHITTELHLADLWVEFRRLGCHIVHVNGKDRLIQPLAIAVETEMPVFVMFDADADTERPDQRAKHERDNRALQTLLGLKANPFPAADISGPNYQIWRTSLTARA
jgi:hypothetical protein